MSYYYNRRKSQLNAISASYTRKNNAKALQELRAAGIDFEEFKRITGYKATAYRLNNDIRKGTAATLKKVNQYRQEKKGRKRYRLTGRTIDIELYFNTRQAAEKQMHEWIIEDKRILEIDTSEDYYIIEE